MYKLNIASQGINIGILQREIWSIESKIPLYELQNTHALHNHQRATRRLLRAEEKVQILKKQNADPQIVQAASDQINYAGQELEQRVKELEKAEERLNRAVSSIEELKKTIERLRRPKDYKQVHETVMRELSLSPINLQKVRAQARNLS